MNNLYYFTNKSYLNISNITVVVISSVGNSLDTSVGQVDAVAASHNLGVAVLAGGESGTGVVVGNGIGVAVGLGLLLVGGGGSVGRGGLVGWGWGAVGGSLVGGGSSHKSESEHSSKHFKDLRIEEGLGEGRVCVCTVTLTELN